jgi:cupin superfamily acireductone dioxygenase involved in methionine salvage
MKQQKIYVIDLIIKKLNNMALENKPFKVTVEHWDEKITVEKDHSDITFDEFVEMLRTLSRGVGFSQDYINEVFGS